MANDYWFPYSTRHDYTKPGRRAVVSANHNLHKNVSPRIDADQAYVRTNESTHSLEITWTKGNRIVKELSIPDISRPTPDPLCPACVLMRGDVVYMTLVGPGGQPKCPVCYGNSVSEFTFCTCGEIPHRIYCPMGADNYKVVDVLQNQFTYTEGIQFIRDLKEATSRAKEVLRKNSGLSEDELADYSPWLFGKNQEFIGALDRILQNDRAGVPLEPDDLYNLCYFVVNTAPEVGVAYITLTGNNFPMPDTGVAAPWRTE